MLNALRAFVLLMILVGNARAGEVLIPPSPQQRPLNTVQEPYGDAFYTEMTTHEMSDSMADAALELLTVLSAIL